MSPITWIAVGWAGFASFMAILLLGALLSERKDRLIEGLEVVNSCIKGFGKLSAEVEKRRLEVEEKDGR